MPDSTARTCYLLLDVDLFSPYRYQKIDTAWLPPDLYEQVSHSVLQAIKQHYKITIGLFSQDKDKVIVKKERDGFSDLQYGLSDLPDGLSLPVSQILRVIFNKFPSQVVELSPMLWGIEGEQDSLLGMFRNFLDSIDHSSSVLVCASVGAHASWKRSLRGDGVQVLTFNPPGRLSGSDAQKAINALKQAAPDKRVVSIDIDDTLVFYTQVVAQINAAIRGMNDNPPLSIYVLAFLHEVEDALKDTGGLNSCYLRILTARTGPTGKESCEYSLSTVKIFETFQHYLDQAFPDFDIKRLSFPTCIGQKYQGLVYEPQKQVTLLQWAHEMGMNRYATEHDCAVVHIDDRQEEISAIDFQAKIKNPIYGVQVYTEHMAKGQDVADVFAKWNPPQLHQESSVQRLLRQIDERDRARRTAPLFFATPQPALAQGPAVARCDRLLAEDDKEQQQLQPK